MSAFRHHTPCVEWHLTYLGEVIDASRGVYDFVVELLEAEAR